MCTVKPSKQVAEQAAAAPSPVPAPQPIADRLAIDPKRKKAPLAGARNGRSSLVIQRTVGGLDQASGLSIGTG